MKRITRVAILANVARRFDRRVIQGVVAFAREVGCWDLYVEEEPAARLLKLDRWPGQGIIASFDEQEIGQAVGGLRIPVVGVGGGMAWYQTASKIPYFATDNAAIGRRAAEHLLECGFSRLAFYGHRRSRLLEWSEERLQAFRGRAHEAGVPCEVYRGRLPTAHAWATLQQELSAWIGALQKPVGLMACTDLRARHVLEVCRTLGLRVPDDVAVIGVDNDEMLCELTTPPLTSIEQGSRRIGYEAAAMLQRLMAGKKVTSLRHTIGPEALVARQSTSIVACEDTDLGAALQFIRQHACDPVTVADVLRIVPVSRSTLERKFHSALGRTIHDEIQRVKLERAKQLLAQTRLLVKQVAKQSGFRYVQYMTTFFRHATGMSPAEYRRKEGNAGRVMV
jgi:LacI family transcriptional regulator